MKESAILALEYLKKQSVTYGLDNNFFSINDFHIHVPEGAIPKDGPSAGITILSALTSLATNNRKLKKSVAMTGEITLRGKVLPVGGIKEKILAAHRQNKNVVLSTENMKDVKEIDAKYVKGLKFHYVNNMKDVLDIVLLKK